MPNSGYHGLINQNYHGNNKQEIFPLGTKYGIDNLPNPAFWNAYIEQQPSAVMTVSVISKEPRNKYSRHLNFSTASQTETDSLRLAMEQLRLGNSSSKASPGPHKGGVKTNSVAPFATLAKPTCGFFFSRVTDNKKRRTGIPSADLVKWRYYGVK